MVQIYFQKFNKIKTTYYQFPFIFCCCYFPLFSKISLLDPGEFPTKHPPPPTPSLPSKKVLGVLISGKSIRKFNKKAAMKKWADRMVSSPPPSSKIYQTTTNVLFLLTVTHIC